METVQDILSALNDQGLVGVLGWLLFLAQGAAKKFKALADAQITYYEKACHSLDDTAKFQKANLKLLAQIRGKLPALQEAASSKYEEEGAA